MNVFASLMLLWKMTREFSGILRASGSRLRLGTAAQLLLLEDGAGELPLPTMSSVTLQVCHLQPFGTFRVIILPRHAGVDELSERVAVVLGSRVTVCRLVLVHVH